MTTTEGVPAATLPRVILAEPARRLSGRRRDKQGHRHSANRKSDNNSDADGDGTGDGGRRKHRKLPWVLGGVFLLMIGGVIWVAASRINTPLARPVAQAAAAAAGVHVVPGSMPALPWPAKGQGAIAVPSIGFTARSGPESRQPIASLTKITTAVVILQDHPLPLGSDGPSIMVTAADAAEYQDELHHDESSVAIQSGEVLTERQMLEALLTQSANDIAFSLAMWDATSIPAFVDRMNALAASLGTTSTHYVDASGYDPSSVSSASDVLRVAMAGMAIASFAQIVAMTSISLPGVGTLHNIVPEVGSNGVIGIKSGYTSKAGACMVLAANRVIRGRAVLVLVAVLGQPTPPPTLPKPEPTTTPTTTPTTPTAPANPDASSTTTTTTTTTPTTTTPTTTTPTTTTSIPVTDLPIADPFKFARPVAETLLAATKAAVIPVTVASAGQVAGTVSASWGGVAHHVPYVTSSGAWLPGWPGQEVSSLTRFIPVAAGSPAGAQIGTSLFAVGAQFQAVPLTLATTVPEPSVWWRLVHA
jgi:D-alanyl-D-alanine carboxypeptidase (penicillin-binding protein 5/6)